MGIPKFRRIKSKRPTAVADFMFAVWVTQEWSMPRDLRSRVGVVTWTGEAPVERRAYRSLGFSPQGPEHQHLTAQVLSPFLSARLKNNGNLPKDWVCLANESVWVSRLQTVLKQGLLVRNKIARCCNVFKVQLEAGRIQPSKPIKLPEENRQ